MTFSENAISDATNLLTVSVVGAGLAGSECALQLAERGFHVTVYEMRAGAHRTPAHKSQDFAEVVCSNSLGSFASTGVTGEMKREAQQLGSFILDAALQARVPAGQALSVDRELFARLVTTQMRQHPRIEIVSEPVLSLDQIPRPAVIATGPLTHETLAHDLQKHFGDEFLYFYDAIAPIIDADSIDRTVAWKGDRWGKGTADYLNCPLDKNQYNALIQAILEARKVEPKEFEKTPYFESCLPVEVLAERGPETLRFGPMSPKGLWNKSQDRRPYAVVQLRQDNQQGTAYNMVGFQTKMAYPDQKRVFQMIPGLEKAEFLKLGSIHRNLYINSPQRLTPTLASRNDADLYFAGQITGVEGYFESTCIGLLVALFIDQKYRLKKEVSVPPRESALGSLLHAITLEEKPNFQPTNINFSLLPKGPEELNKVDRKQFQIHRARQALENWRDQLGLPSREDRMPDVTQTEHFKSERAMMEKSGPDSTSPKMAAQTLAAHKNKLMK